MKRSEINKALRELEAMCKKYHCYLPPFCSFTPDEWQSKGHEYDEVRECMLGWDITDYGQGKFNELGYEGVKAAVAALNGENLGGAVTDTGVSVLTK